MAILTRHSVAGFACGVLAVLLVEAGVATYIMNRAQAPRAETGLPALALPATTTLDRFAGGFSDLNGKTTSYAELSGRVVVINRWATWCPPCRAEMPSLDALWEKFKDNPDVGIYCISDEAPEAVRAHPVTKALGLPLYVFSTPIPVELQTNGVPTTFIYDRAGRLVFTHTGMAQWDADQVVTFLQQLAGGAAPKRE